MTSNWCWQMLYRRFCCAVASVDWAVVEVEAVVILSRAISDLGSPGDSSRPCPGPAAGCSVSIPGFEWWHTCCAHFWPRCSPRQPGCSRLSFREIGAGVILRSDVADDIQAPPYRSLQYSAPARYWGLAGSAQLVLRVRNALLQVFQVQGLLRRIQCRLILQDGAGQLQKTAIAGRCCWPWPCPAPAAA